VAIPGWGLIARAEMNEAALEVDTEIVPAAKNLVGMLIERGGDIKQYQ
jgi:hypothetical protein